MKRTHMTSAFLAAALSLTLLTGIAGALDYTVEGMPSPEYYRSTDYAEVNGAAYNYGGRNVTDSATTELPYGVSSLAQIGPMEKNRTPSLPAVSNGSGTSGVLPELPSTWVPPVVEQIKFTDAATLQRSDGSIGTLKIPRLDINMKVYEGETAESMRKGVGHFNSTSGWAGNIGVCGHNRGAPYIIGSIKNLKEGDTIQYATTLGTRTYSVVLVEKIRSSDWSYLTATTDNRITLITCVAGEPDLRWCVQGVEKK